MASTYTIVSQAPKTVMLPGGTLVPSIVVTFTTKPSEQSGQVTIPASQYTADEVDRLVSEQAKTIEEIQNL